MVPALVGSCSSPLAAAASCLSFDSFSCTSSRFPPTGVAACVGGRAGEAPSPRSGVWLQKIQDGSFSHWDPVAPVSTADEGGVAFYVTFVRGEVTSEF